MAQNLESKAGDRAWSPRIPGGARISRRSFVVGLAATAGLLAPSRTRAASSERLRFEDLYRAAGAEGLKLSARVADLAGRSVSVRGYMAPPLKAESDFFVLTRYPMSICPFCSSAADWPADIIVVYLAASARTLEPSQTIEVAGTLETGIKVDSATGFVSLVRLVGAGWRTV